AADDVSEGKLQKCQIAAVGGKSFPGNAQEGQRAGLRGDDRNENEPPTDVPVAAKICARVFLSPAEPGPEARRADDVKYDDNEVERGELAGHRRGRRTCFRSVTNLWTVTILCKFGYKKMKCPNWPIDDNSPSMAARL